LVDSYCVALPAVQLGTRSRQAPPPAQLPLLPVKQKFCKKTQNRPQKNLFGREKLNCLVEFALKTAKKKHFLEGTEFIQNFRNLGGKFGGTMATVAASAVTQH